MRKNTLNIWLIIISLGLFSLNFTPVFAQQMLVQIIGGGYRLDGPTIIDFPLATASVTEPTVSERKISSIGDEIKYLHVIDENGGNTFEVQVTTSTPFNNTDRTGTIPLSNFQVKNNDDTGIITINGKSDGLSLFAETNDYINFEPVQTHTLATGSGNQPGEWKIHPQFKLEIPEATPLGNYETTITFTII
jgi:hypothetical protein